MSYVKMNNNYKSIDGIMKEIFNEFPSAVSKAVREDVLHYPPVNIIDKAAGYSVAPKNTNLNPNAAIKKPVSAGGSRR